MNYSYGNSDWKDLLTEYNGTAINYDLSGNPLNWRNASSLTWDGRRLSGMTLTDGTELAFEYNADGLRTFKTVGNSTVQYVWNDGSLVAEIRDGYTMKFLYNNGEAAGFSYNGADYYYGKDSFGVIRYLYNTSGEVVTTYTYDAWGTVLSVTGTLAETGGTVTPGRNKSDYLDSETGWYSLQSRDYDPAVGRFLNADEVSLLGATNTLLGYDLFSYCENNPVSNDDRFGYWKISLKVDVVAVVLNVILYLAVIVVQLYAKAKILNAARKLFRSVRQKFDKIIMSISVFLVNAFDTILYEVFKHYNSAGVARITVAASTLAKAITYLLDFSIGKMVASVIDRFDKDGKSGYIRF